MYTFSDSAKQLVWDALIVQSAHYFESRVVINDVSYGQDKIVELNTYLRVFGTEQPSVGSCISAELYLKILAPSASIPRMATVQPYVRVTVGTTHSAWMPQGVFFIDTREESKNDDGLPVLTIHAYDDMLRTEADYPDTDTNFPKSDIDTVKVIAKAMGLQPNISVTTGIDPRTVTLMNKAYQIKTLPIGYSMREVLGNIGAMYGGNWIMTYDRQLLLVPIGGIPPETNYLVTGIGEPITFGGDRILV